ncbi:hypothetical protein KC345_g5242 [Hortaea werneckii]|nr:hypothetical protein KC345_g5242 [Hortaea werneckii]
MQTDQIQTDQKVEEETVPNYNSSRYYLVQIRDIFLNRYEVLGKLGFGSTSTTWFCRDHHAKNFKVLKICIHENGNPLREQGVYSQFSGLRTSNVGYFFTRIPKKRFEVQGPSGHQHACFAFTPAACTIEEILKCHGSQSINLNFIKSTLLCAVRALDFLHSDAHLIHTDVKLDNMFMTLTGDAELEALACFMVENPPEFKVDETGRKIYAQHTLPHLGANSWNHAILGDLGEAYVFDEDEDDGLLGPSIVGPAALRSPEVILGEDKANALDFVKRIFRWKPEERSTAKQLLDHPFFNFEGTDAEENSSTETDAETTAEKTTAVEASAEEASAKKMDAEQTGAEQTGAEQTGAEGTTAEETTAEEASTEKADPTSQYTGSGTSKDCTDIAESQTPSEEFLASPYTLNTQDLSDAREESQQPPIHARRTPESAALIKGEQSDGEPSEAPKSEESEDNEEEPEQTAADAKKD